MTTLLQMHPLDWLDLFTHYLSLSLMAIGGAITTAPDMHRYLVDQRHWMTESQFNASITLAQAAPGPNILFVALMGWQVGLNAGSLPAALLGVGLTMTGMLIPSATLTYVASRWGHNNRDLRAVRAFKQGLAPVVVGLILGPVAEAQLRRALQISLGDPMVLLQSPMSATLLGIALLALIAPFALKGMSRFKASED